MNNEQRLKIKTWLAIFSFIFSVVFAGMGFFAIPIGEISYTVLLYVGELLLFCSILLGISIKNVEILSEITKLVKDLKNSDGGGEERD